LIVDKFIDHRIINKFWNSILKKHGYIRKYQEKMLIHHKNGFTPFNHLLKNWDIRKQFIAYKKGLKNNFNLLDFLTQAHFLIDPTA
jgi:hypothetical protein